MPTMKPIIEFSSDGTHHLVMPPGNTIHAFVERYRAMQQLLARAVSLLDHVLSGSAPVQRIMIESDLSMARWMLLTVTTTANFMEAYELKKCIRRVTSSAQERLACYERLAAIVENEEKNTRSALPALAADVRFSNRPFEVKRFQTIRHCGVDVTHGLVLLFGIGTKALPSWDSKTRWNNLRHDLAVRRTAGSSGHANSPHPSSREGHLSTARWSSSFLLSDVIL